MPGALPYSSAAVLAARSRLIFHRSQTAVISTLWLDFRPATTEASSRPRLPIPTWPSLDTFVGSEDAGVGYRGGAQQCGCGQEEGPPAEIVASRCWFKGVFADRRFRGGQLRGFVIHRLQVTRDFLLPTRQMQRLPAAHPMGPLNSVNIITISSKGLSNKDYVRKLWVKRLCGAEWGCIFLVRPVKDAPPPSNESRWFARVTSAQCARYTNRTDASGNPGARVPG